MQDQNLNVLKTKHLKDGSRYNNHIFLLSLGYTTFMHMHYMLHRHRNNMGKRQQAQLTKRQISWYTGSAVFTVIIILVCTLIYISKPRPQDAFLAFHSTHVVKLGRIEGPIPKKENQQPQHADPLKQLGLWTLALCSADSLPLPLPGLSWQQGTERPGRSSELRGGVASRLLQMWTGAVCASEQSLPTDSSVQKKLLQERSLLMTLSGSAPDPHPTRVHNTADNTYFDHKQALSLINVYIKQ